jgi:protein-tyrosine phosphatase
MNKDVCWIASTGLAIVMRPRADDWLENDLARLKNAGIQTLVSTVEDWEASELGLDRERELAGHLGLKFISFPMHDRSTPNDGKSFTAFVESLAARLEAGEKIGVHCRGCIGRSTVVTACTLIRMGWSAADALQTIEIAREFPVPDTEEQRAWIMSFRVAR